jgi:hypothetical protein
MNNHLGFQLSILFVTLSILVLKTVLRSLLGFRLNNYNSNTRNQSNNSNNNINNNKSIIGNERQSLFDSIKSRSSTLRKVSLEERQAIAAEKKRRASTFGSSVVSAILERRKFLERDASDSDSDNDSNVWSS